MADPVVICENDGDRLELGANPSSDTWLMLAWAGSYLVEDCAIGIPREALANLAMALLPHLTGDELRRVAEAMPRVAGAWKHRTRWGSRPLDGAPKDAADWAHYEDAHAARHVDGWTMAAPYQAVTHVSVPPVATWHPTARAAQAACDARLEADKVRLCGEVVRDG